MGFLKKLFEKKDCEICGGEIGLLGNKKLVDGDCCKDCAAKLSPWFTERKESTVAEIKEQLAYREANAAELKSSFKPTKTLGDYYKMYVMYENGCPSRFVVSSAANYVEANADIIRFTDVVSCNVDIRDSRTEVKRLNENNERVSYVPPRYEFSYEFYIELGVNNPYFDKIRFKVNRSTVKLISELQTHRSSSGIGQFLLSNNDFDPTYNPEFRQYQMMCDEIAEIVRQGQQGVPAASEPAKTPEAAKDAYIAAAAESGLIDIPMDQLDKEQLVQFQAKIMTLKMQSAMTGQDPAPAILAYIQEEIDAAPDGVWKDYLQVQYKLENKMGGGSNAEAHPNAEDDGPKLGTPGVCPDCGATDQTGKFCEYCGAKLG